MRKLAHLLLKTFGWDITGTVPELSHCVLIVAPHTSNWDFIIGILYKISLNLKLNYFGKDSLFRWYNGWFFKFFGGIPVVRTASHNVVDDKVNTFKSQPHFWLAMAPEGTRAYSDYWRSGFYYITLKARVPLVLAHIDAKTKTIGIGKVMQISGDIEEDMKIIREYYKDKVGIKQHLCAPIELKPSDKIKIDG